MFSKGRGTSGKAWIYAATSPKKNAALETDCCGGTTRVIPDREKDNVKVSVITRMPFGPATIVDSGIPICLSRDCIIFARW